MTLLADMLDVDILDRHVAEGNVRKQVHPTEPLAIYNYTDRCTYDAAWDDVTEQCRGLVVNERTSKVVGRPWRKFRNVSEHDSPDLPDIPWDMPFNIYTKMDGSMGAGIWMPDSTFAIVTRGSFTSEQAVHATALWHERYAHIAPPVHFTFIWEVCSPENRIVVTYDFDDLVLLGAVNIRHGRTVSPQTAADMLLWPGPIAKRWPRDTPLDEERDNEEGYVLHWPHNDFRVKSKFPAYLRMHRIISHLSSRTIWDALRNGQSPAELAEGIPDEFFPFVQDWTDRLEMAEADLGREAQNALREVRDLPSRKEQAAVLMEGDRAIAGLVFALLDGKSIVDQIWKLIEPPLVYPFDGGMRSNGLDTV